MNLCYREIAYMFERAGIEDFASLPAEDSVRARFAREWRNLNAFLDAAKMQGFTWNKKRYKWTTEDGRYPHYATIAFDEATYYTLAQRYKELHNGTGTAQAPTDRGRSL